MAVRLDVVGIAVGDMAVSLQFYRLLGLPAPEGAEAEAHVELDLGGFRLAWDTVELLRWVYDGWEAPLGHRIELAFRCDSRDAADALYARMTEHGYPTMRAYPRSRGAIQIRSDEWRASAMYSPTRALVARDTADAWWTRRPNTYAAQRRYRGPVPRAPARSLLRVERSTAY